MSIGIGDDVAVGVTMTALGLMAFVLALDNPEMDAFLFLAAAVLSIFGIVGIRQSLNKNN